MSSRRALLRHLWSMLQTRAEAAGLVLSLQRSALGRGLGWYAIAAMAAMAFMFALLLLIALGTPAEYRALVLGLVTLALAGVAVYCAVHAKRELSRDAALITDFTTGLRLDLAMVNLALKDPETENEEKLEAREHAKTKVREAAEDKAESTMNAAGSPAAAAATEEGPGLESAAAAARAVTPMASEIEHPSAPITPPDEMTNAPPPPSGRDGQENRSYGNP
jgi:hypothetical protein